MVSDSNTKNEEVSITVKEENNGMKKQVVPPKGIKGLFAKLKAKQNAKANAEDEIPDPHKPVIRFYHHFQIFWIIGWTWIIVAIGAVFGAGAGSIPLFFYLLLGNLMDALAAGGDIKPKVNEIAMYMVIIAAAALVANFFSQLMLNTAQEIVGNRIKNAYFRRVTQEDISFFDYRKTGVLISRFDDIGRIKEGYTLKLASLLQFFTQTVVGIVLAFRSSWKMSLVMLATAPVMTVLLACAGGAMKAFTKLVSDANGSVVSTATEVISSMRTVRSMAGEEKEQKKFAMHLRKNNILGLGSGIAMGAGHGLIHGIIWATCSLAFWYGGQLVSEPQEGVSIGNMMTVFGMMLFAVMGLAQMLGQLPDIAKAAGSSVQILLILNRQPQISFKGGRALTEVKGHIEFEKVEFTYPTRPDFKVLKGFSLDIAEGKRVALVGSSGSGKSTILGLVERFYKPDSGAIKIDGVPLDELDPQWLHRVIGIVTQEPVLFNTTIRKNITYAVGEASDEEVIAAAKAANCHDFIVSLPDGYNTVVGERGSSLSGGQKQRVAIARSVLQNPKILLLDEATSALDTESERLVQEALNRLMLGRTCIMIAHRLSTVQDCDELVVMKNGEIVERGSHRELLKNHSGHYYQLARKQMMFGEDENLSLTIVEDSHQDVSPTVQQENSDVKLTIAE